MEPLFFETVDELRAWFHDNHARLDEAHIGFYKKASGRGGVTYQEALDAALCVGWIDGVRRSLDEAAYMIRFTPRRKGSNWSGVNTRRMEQLIAEGLVTEAGLAAFELRHASRRGPYSFEAEDVDFGPEEEAALSAHAAALSAHAAARAFWDAQPRGYRRVAMHWVTSAKRPETRARRLAKVITESAAGRRV
ncbi:MAG: YdeI/OmpD-associated family protein [Dehalococcoidia bacterium]|nr:YdeI/OmpD-associated family protein [Dehalococcoidia bacterium]